MSQSKDKKSMSVAESLMTAFTLMEKKHATPDTLIGITILLHLAGVGPEKKDGIEGGTFAHPLAQVHCITGGIKHLQNLLLQNSTGNPDQ